MTLTRICSSSTFTAYFGSGLDAGPCTTSPVITLKISAKCQQNEQLRLDSFPSEPEKKPQEKNKQIVINGIHSATKYDEMVVSVEFELIPSKTAFSKIISTLWFDECEAKSAIIVIPQRFGNSSEFQLKSELDMRGIPSGNHIIDVKLRYCYSPCYAIKKEIIDYTSQDKKARYRKIPIAKKIAGCDFDVVSGSEKNIYQEIEKTKKKELISKQDKW